MTTTYLPKQLSPAIRIPFENGWRLFTDLSNMIGGHRALLAFQQCFDICIRSTAMVQSRSARIASSPYINPDDIDGVDITIEALALELLMTMIKNDFLPDGKPLKWELVNISSYKLTIRAKEFAHVTHPLLGKPHEQ